MKICLLVTGNMDPSLSINRFNLIPFLISKYFEEIEDVEVVFKRAYPNITYNVKRKDYLFSETFDHIILINSIGFYKKDIDYLNYLKTKSTYSVSSVCINTKYFKGEDMLFYISNRTLNRERTFYLGPVSEEKLLIPKKEDDILYFLIDSPHNNINNNYYPIIFKKIKKFMDRHSDKSIPFVLKRLINDGIETFDETIDEFTLFQKLNHLELIDEICKVNIFFVTNNGVDHQFLFEMSMACTLIVSPKNTIFSDSVKKHLNIFELQNNNTKIPWKDILSNINDLDDRSKLIVNKLTWRNASIQIYHSLLEYQNKIEPKKVSIIKDMPKTVVNGKSKKISKVSISPIKKPEIKENNKTKKTSLFQSAI